PPSAVSSAGSSSSPSPRRRRATAPTPSSTPTTITRAASARACRWSRSSPAPSPSAPAAPADARGRSPRSAPASAPSSPACCTCDSPLQLGPYLLLAMFVALLAMLYTRSFYALVHVFHQLKMPRILKPALGGLLTGAVGVGLYFVFREDVRTLAVLSTGYGIL